MNTPDEQAGSYVVVGLDGSTASRRALEWALVEGRTSRLPVLALHAWRSAQFGIGGASRTDVGRERAERLLNNEIDAISPESKQDPVLVLKVPEGDPVTALTEAASHASVLILGGRDDGTIARGCREGADCPVVVVTATGARRIESARRSKGRPISGPNKR